MRAPDDPTPEELRAQQSKREREESERIERAPSSAEQDAAQRRAEKAAYLKQKLDERIAGE